MPYIGTPINEDDEDKHVHGNPFQHFGVGINSYFKLLEQLMKALLIISVLFSSVLIIYGRESALTISEKFTLGNLKFSSNECVHINLNTAVHKNNKKLNLVCKIGEIKNIFHVGIMP